MECAKKREDASKPFTHLKNLEVYCLTCSMYMTKAAAESSHGGHETVRAASFVDAETQRVKDSYLQILSAMQVIQENLTRLLETRPDLEMVKGIKEYLNQYSKRLEFKYECFIKNISYCVSLQKGSSINSDCISCLKEMGKFHQNQHRVAECQSLISELEKEAENQHENRNAAVSHKIKNILSGPISEYLHNSKYLMDFLYRRGGIRLYDLTTLKKLRNIDTQSWPILQYSASFFKKILTKDGRLFISGHGKEPIETYEFDFESLGLQKRADQLHFRYNFEMVELRHGCLLTVGGQYSAIPYNICEAYNVFSDSWESISSLNNPQFSHTVFSFDDQIVFTYCGWMYKELANSFFERIELDINLKGNWENINVDIKIGPLTSRSAKIQRVDQEKVLIFGGENGLQGKDFLFDHQSLKAEVLDAQNPITKYLPQYRSASFSLKFHNNGRFYSISSDCLFITKDAQIVKIQNMERIN